MKIDGRCHCGQLTFEADVDPASVSLCHCTDCQTLTGTAYRVSVPVQAEKFSLRGTGLKTYVKTAESGAARHQTFCGNCGSPIYSCSAEAHPQSYNLRLGSITQRAEFTPSRQIWRRSALGWVDHIADVPASDRQ